ncbi:hypothetical protein LXT21_20660 [Myxococcus sp. K38C18041901]|uniref:hypothetical protein n=1 Tax=Myxococcus guangdongensis TaxID=2906760 RepID=UPI0020A7859C|nr:hypothetical protein [Myxococcus guangdongensis]MCP3061197.1 hypothetical protein [Myxococcus guangdongensis]
MSRRRAPEDLHALLGAPSPDWERLTKALKKLPQDVDPVLAAGAVLHLLPEDRSSFWTFGRHCQQLPAPVIRAVLERLAGDMRPAVFFLRECVDREGSDEALCESWRAALQGMLDLDVTYAWGSKQRKAKLRGLAANPVLLQALQTVVVASEKVSLDMLAVLTIDASEASLDALIPHVERAVQSQGWELDRLEDLRTHASSTPALEALFERMEGLLQARRARSPALELARALGFGEPDVFWFRFYATGGEEGDARSMTYRDHCHLNVDSRKPVWFDFSMATRGEQDALGMSETVFRVTSEGLRKDTLGLGDCEPTRFPEWMARGAERLRTRWSLEQMSVMTSLRGKQRTRLEAWLRGRNLSGK